MDPAQEQQRTAATSNNAQQWVSQSRASEQSQRNGLEHQGHDAFFPSFSYLFIDSEFHRDESNHKIVASQKWETWHLSKTCLNRHGEMGKGPNKTQAVSQRVWKVRGCSSLSMTVPGTKHRTGRECWGNPEICWQRPCIRATSNSPDSRDGYLCWLQARDCQWAAHKSCWTPNSGSKRNCALSRRKE